MDWNEFALAVLAVATPIGIAVLVWIAKQAAAVAKQKWGVNIDVAALEKELAARKIERSRQEDFHSAVRTGVAGIIGEIERTMTPDGQIVVTPSIRERVMDHARRSVPDAIAALSPAPDVIDHLLIRFAQEQVVSRIRGTAAKRGPE